MVKLRNDLNFGIDFGSNTIMNNQIFEIKYEDVKNSSDILTNEQWNVLQTYIYTGMVLVYLDSVILSKNDGVRLIQELVSNPTDFAFKYLDETISGGITIDPNIDENNDGVVSRSEILDANDDSTNNWADLHAIATGNVVD